MQTCANTNCRRQTSLQGQAATTRATPFSMVQQLQLLRDSKRPSMFSWYGFPSTEMIRRRGLPGQAGSGMDSRQRLVSLLICLDLRSCSPLKSSFSPGSSARPYNQVLPRDCTNFHFPYRIELFGRLVQNSFSCGTAASPPARNGKRSTPFNISTGE
jgi:hypothetical protein